jgi:anaerobic ribonucleoside-triphosphate reductase
MENEKKSCWYVQIIHKLRKKKKKFIVLLRKEIMNRLVSQVKTCMLCRKRSYAAWLGTDLLYVANKVRSGHRYICL